MTTLTGVVRDTQKKALAHTDVRLTYTRGIVGFDGGAAVRKTHEAKTSAQGLLSVPNLVPGQYDIVIFAPASTSETQTKVGWRGVLVIPAQPSVTLEDALTVNFAPVTPTSVQQASAAAQAAERAQSVASISEKSADYTLVDPDKGTLIASTGAALVTVTIPTDATGGFTETIVISFQQFGSGAMSVAAASGVMLNGVTGGSTQIQQQWGTAQAIRIGENEWTIFGLTDEVTG